MAKTKDVIAMMDNLKSTEAWKYIIEDLERSYESRKMLLLGLGNPQDSMGIDFDKPYSQHDLWRNELRWIEILKDIPAKIIRQEEVRKAQEEVEEASSVQQQLDALTEMTS
jgi:hypothetical protein